MRPIMRPWLFFVCAFIICSMRCRDVAAEVLSKPNGDQIQDSSICDPYYVGQHSPKLTTPQWVGEADVEAVVILSIDDMREADKYEAFLRPLLDRLKKIDGRAPVSIFTNSIDPQEPQLQSWLKEGLSLEVHTVDHPCPLLKDGDFAAAKSTYDRCVDMMADVPNSQPVAFRMPCCDSLNTPSPRFWKEIFEKKSPGSNFLSIDSSVFNIFTADDPDLTEAITQNKGEPRFRRYVPFKSFVNTIENYPYPYIVGTACWEFPCVVPSDWEAQHVQKPNNPDTVRDLKRALDATVTKKGVMPVVFHPHGWIRNDQLVEFVDYAVEKYGSRVKFLNFAECLERLNTHLLGGVALRTAHGNEFDVRLLDVNSDGYVDVMRQATGKAGSTLTRVWNPKQQRFEEDTCDLDMHNLLVVQREGQCRLLEVRDHGFFEHARTANGWQRKAASFDRSVSSNLKDVSTREITLHAYDVDADGNDEIFFSRDDKTVVASWNGNQYAESPYQFPAGAVGNAQRDTGVRLLDLNGDHRLDIVKSNGDDYGVWLFAERSVGSEAEHFLGWEQVRSGKQTDANAIPTITRQDGTDNGAWFHSGHLWVQNEFTDRNPDLVDRIAFHQLAKTPTSVLSAADADETSEHPFGKARNLRESLSTFQIPEGAKLEVAAAEPQISDPIAFDWGYNGELWVVEMGDYPNGANWHGPGDPKGDPGGCIKKLEDRDGDGHFETAHAFLDGLSSPTGVKAWRDGVLVCAPPNIIYAVDTNGDHIADKQEVLFTGMREGNQQHRANGLRWGLDHWLHLANGDSGGVVRSLKTGQDVNTSGRDFRIKPDEGLIELTSGPTQFGRNRDEVGNWFGGDNSHPVWHYTLEEKYMRRNPHYSPPSARHQIAEAPGAAPVFPISETVERFNDFDRANRFTSACSPEIYRDRSVYVCEPVHNLVHRSTLTRDGATFVSSRRSDEQQSEFLASSDNWFRPVMVRSGPDRAIWVADMYRMIMEHPEWIPMQWQKRIDHLSGNDKGRIYRIVLPNQESGASELGEGIHDWRKVAKADNESLVEMLDSELSVLRDMVQQEILARGESDFVPLLKELRKSTDHAEVAIDYLLAHFGEFGVEQLTVSDLTKPHILRLLEPRLERSNELRDLLVEFCLQPIVDEQVRLQAAYTLGYCDHDQTGQALAGIALQSLDGEHDRYVRAAVMSSVNEKNIAETLEHFLAACEQQTGSSSNIADLMLEDLLGSAIGFESYDSVRLFVDHLAKNPKALDRWTGPIARLLKSAERNEKDLDGIVGEDGVGTLKTLAKRASQVLVDEDQTSEARMNAMQLCGFFPELKSTECRAMTDLLSPRHPQQLQRLAIERLAQIDSEGTGVDVFAQWASFTPALRDTTLSVATRNTAWTRAMFDQIENGTILPVQVSLRHQHQLSIHRDAKIRERANVVFQEVESDRQSIVKQYARETTTTPDIARGKSIFKKQCATCHMLEGQGANIGPDLTAISDKSMPAMLTAILDPNAAVEEKYLDYTVLTSEGETHHGILREESATSITLATPEGKQVVVLRKDLEQLKATGKSVMPEGLEQVLSAQNIADVTGYIQSISVPRKTFPGNVPQLAPVRDDGSIRLFAIHAEIYGPSLVLEEKYHNLGFWSNDRDRAVWTIDAPAAGEYELLLDYSCSPQQAKNRYQVRVNGQVVGGEVDVTGSWDSYTTRKVGMIQLPDKPVQLTIQSDGPIDGFLMDLRTILLYPPE